MTSRLYSYFLMVFKRELQLSVLFLFSFICSFAQNFSPSDLIRQNKKQRKLLIEQIGAYRSSVKVLEKGNEVLKLGTDLIGFLRQKELGLHSTQFERLGIVNPNILNAEVVQQVQLLFNRFFQQQGGIYSLMRKDKFILKNEIRLFKDLLNALNKMADFEFSSFAPLVLNGRYQMNDDDRIWQLKRIYSQMKKLVFGQENIARQLNILAHTRKGLETDGRLLKTLNE